MVSSKRNSKKTDELEDKLEGMEDKEVIDASPLIEQAKSGYKTATSLEVPTQIVAYFFGVTPKCIVDWTHKGCPKISTGKYNLKSVYDWVESNLKEGGETGTSMTKVKTEYWQAKAEREKLYLQEDQNKLIKKEDVHSKWALRIQEITKGLDYLSSRLPPLLLDKSEDEMADIIEKETWALRDNYARNGKFCVVIDKKEKAKKAAKKKPATKAGRPRKQVKK